MRDRRCRSLGKYFRDGIPSRKYFLASQTSALSIFSSFRGLLSFPTPAAFRRHREGHNYADGGEPILERMTVKNHNRAAGRAAVEQITSARFDRLRAMRPPRASPTSIDSSGTTDDRA
jgi:hypothetical protein